jgi:NTP pyrophosphatase (non-canonical NTP hydrolase)
VNGLNKLALECHEIAAEHGFWTYDGVSLHVQYAAKIALIHEEVSEALRELRRTTPTLDDEHWDKFGDELVDAIIRILDLAGQADIDLDAKLARIMEQNRNRPYMHGRTL